MNIEHTSNSALPTITAFHYQVLVALYECFSDNYDSVWIEQDGDVSVLSQNVNASKQTEVKDYSAPLTDNHENLWNTLKNWLAADFNHSIYGRLILHTTQSFGSQSLLKGWNEKNAEEKYDILRKIFSKRTSEEIQAEKKPKSLILQIEVMSSANERKLKEILQKVILNVESDNSDQIKQKLFSKFIGIPEANQNAYMEGLVGFVYANVNSKSWSISKNNFKDKLIELTAIYHKQSFTFPQLKIRDASKEEIMQYDGKLFVKKIKDIEYDEKIPGAVGDWIEYANSIDTELDEHPTFESKTKDYRELLLRKFRYKYDNALLDDASVLIKSKRLYNTVMDEPPPHLDQIDPGYVFRNGMMHDIMDDDENKTKWRVE